MAEAGGLNPLQHGFESHRGHSVGFARSVFDCSLRSLRIALGSRCLPHSLADGEALSALSLVQAATRNPGRADRALESADFVVARRRQSVVCSLRLHCSLRSLRLALVGCCLPHSLADERRVCSLARPGQRRASLPQHGGARSGVELLAPCLIARYPWRAFPVPWDGKRISSGSRSPQQSSQLFQSRKKRALAQRFSRLMCAPTTGA
jgi:hypothetical protein